MDDNMKIPNTGDGSDNEKTKVIRMDGSSSDPKSDPGTENQVPQFRSSNAETKSVQADPTNIPPTSDSADRTIYQSGPSVTGKSAPGVSMQAPSQASPVDQTRIEIKNEHKGQPAGASQQSSQQSPPPATPASSKTEELKDALIQSGKPKGGGISTGVAIGGAAAAGLAGVALGAAYSDEIKDAVSGMGTAGTADDGSVTDESPLEVAATPAAETVGDASSDPQFISISHTDSSGTAYAVYLSDMNNDGEVDYAEADITAIDGSNIHVVASGDGFINMFQEAMYMAEPGDYIGQGGYAIPTSMVDESASLEMYDIMPGDTLSEIAAAYNTSIVNILDLNPGITDPDMIVSGEQLIVPTGDNITDPYEGYDAFLGGASDVDDPAGIIPVEASEDDGLFASGLGESELEIDAPSNIELGSDVVVDGFSADYASVDWASFSDEPVSQDQSEYQELMMQTDFDSYESETFQIADNYDNLSDSTSAASEFM